MPTPRSSPLPVPSTDGVGCLLWDLGGEGPALLLVHATGFHHRVYLPLARHLDAFHCWGCDLRGHGDATSPKGHRYEWQAFTEDLQQIVGRLDERPLFAFGHSMGSTVLLRLEEQHPGTFAALWLYEPIVFPRERVAADSTAPMVEAARRRRGTFPSREAAIENFASKPPFDALDPDCLRAYVEYGFSEQADGRVTLKLPGEEEGRIYAMSADHDTFERLGDVRCPVLVARGGREPDARAEAAALVAARLPAGELVTFDELGHFGPLENPESVAASITDFFEP